MFRHSKRLRLGWVTIIAAGTVIGAVIVLSCKPEELGLKPTAEFHVSTARNGSIDLTNTSKFGFRCKWDFGDGSVDSINWSPCHTFPSNGTYTIKLIVVGASDQATTTTQTVAVTNSLAGDWQRISFMKGSCVNPGYNVPEQALPGVFSFSIPYCPDPEYPWLPTGGEERGDSILLGNPVHTIYVLSGDSLTVVKPISM